MNENTNSSKVISMGEMQVGQYITILNWKPIEITKFCPSPENPFVETAVKTQHVDHSYCGHVLKILALSLPYIAVKVFGAYVATLDTRLFNAIELSPEYVKAILEDEKP